MGTADSERKPCLPPDPQTPSGAIKPILPPIAPQWKCSEGLQPHCCAGTLQEGSREAIGCVVCTILFSRYFLSFASISPSFSFIPDSGRDMNSMANRRFRRTVQVDDVQSMVVQRPLLRECRSGNVSSYDGCLDKDANEHL